MAKHTVSVTLHVSEGKHANWEHTSAKTSPPTIYAYRYTPDNGHVRKEVKSGDVDVVIDLQSQGKGTYRIADVDFAFDEFSQLEKASVGDKRAVIHNVNDEVQQAYYCVIVENDAGVQFVCDPMIANFPKAP